MKGFFISAQLPHWLASLAITALYLFPFLLPLPAQAAPQVQEVTGPKSGVTAWLIEDHALPMFSLQLAFAGAGGTSDPEGQEGRASLTADLLLEGAGGMDALAFRRALEERAIDLEFHTDEDNCYATLKSLSAHRDRAFELLALALTKPRFDADAVERVRAAALAGLRRLEERPAYLVDRELRARLFPSHAYGRPGNGTESSVAHLSREQIAALPAEYFSRKNLMLAVAGDVDAETLATLLDAYFGALPETAAAAPDTEDVEPAFFTTTAVVARDVPQTAVAFALPAIRRDDPDFYALYLINHMLGGGTLTSRLAIAIREEKGLAYYVTSSVDILQHTHLIAGRFGTRSEQAGEALAILRETLTAAGDKGFTQAELDDARRYVTGSFPLQLDSTEGLAGYLLSMQLHRLGRDYLDRRNGYFEAVTLADIQRVAERTLKGHPPAIAAAGTPILKEAP